MIRALLNTKPDVWPAEPIDESKPFKWQTRWIIHDEIDPAAFGAVLYRGREWRWTSASGKTGIFLWNEFRCPMQTGDVFYAKETFSTLDCHQGQFVFKADGTSNLTDMKWKPSIFMPKAAARLWFRVMNVRVERVNAISEIDARAEGVKYDGEDRSYAHKEAGVEYTPNRTAYAKLWNSINENRRFEKGPFVFVYDIARISRP